MSEEEEIDNYIESLTRKFNSMLFDNIHPASRRCIETSCAIMADITEINPEASPGLLWAETRHWTELRKMHALEDMLIILVEISDKLGPGSDDV